MYIQDFGDQANLEVQRWNNLRKTCLCFTHSGFF